MSQQSGTKKVKFEGVVQNPEGPLDIMPEELKLKATQCHLLDVRRPDEWVGELGHIEGSKFATLESDLTQFLEAVKADERQDTWVFVCRSGGRSARAASMAMQMGFSNTYNMMGGMLRWNALGYPIKRTK